MIPVVLCAAAGAGQWGPPEPYVLPRLNLQAISVDGVFSAQAVFGADLGLLTRYSDPPHWLNRSRMGATGIVGLTSGSFGADARVGSFWGPDLKHLTVLVGPDVFANGYGTPASIDYHLPWSPGVEAHGEVVLQPLSTFRLVGIATPGWLFVGERHSPDLVGIHELTLSAAAVVDADRLALTVGYSRQWAAIGVVEGLILAVGL